MVKKSQFAFILTFFFCVVHFTLIPEKFGNESFLILLIPGVVLLLGNSNISKVTFYTFLAVLVCCGLLILSKYSFSSTLILWMTLLYIYTVMESINKVDTVIISEKILWGAFLIICICTFFLGKKTIIGDFLFISINDGNYSAMILFLFFLYAEKRGIKAGRVLLLATILWFSSSRSLILMALLFFLIRVLKHYNIPMPKFRKEIVFLLILGAAAFTVLFSYIWVRIFPYASVGAYKTTLNDGSNWSRFSANIYAWENQLSKIDFNMLFCGFGNDLKRTMGIANNETNVLFNGVRLFQTHNSVLNVLVSIGWIPGLVFLWLLSSFISRYFTSENYEYIIPFLVNSMVLAEFRSAYLILWCMVVALPSVKCTANASITQAVMPDAAIEPKRPTKKRKKRRRLVWKPPIWLDEDDGKATGIREENVSFGVFGTLVRRSVARPADLFRIMEQNDPSVPEHFAEKRMEAERAAFARLGVRMGLADIYEELLPLYGAHTNDLMALEIQYEIAGCRPVPENIDLVNRCMEHDKNVFLMADTYLPSSVIRRMLDVCGVYHYDRLYVSCEEGACKADGSLFWKVLADQEIRPHELRHIGSDRQGDITEPWRVGVHVKRGKKKDQSAVDTELPEGIAVYERTLQACIQNCADDLDSDNARLGCETFGPLLAGFMAWLREQLRRDGIQDVYFLAGDGSVMKQAFDALEDGGFRTHSLYFPEQTADQDHEALLAYIRACGMQGRVALVDTGRAAVQKTLENIIAEAELDIQVKGYYVGLNGDTDGMQAAGYLYERGKGAETLEKLSPVMALFDTVFHAPHGAVRRIAMRDGQPVPELDVYEYASDEGRICDEIAILRAYQAGALALVQEMNTAFPGGVPQIPGEAVLLPLLRMGTNPTRQEAELWGDFRVFRDGKAVPMARPKGIGSYLLHPGQFKRDYAASPWKTGFLRRLIRLPLPYDKIAKRHARNPHERR